MYESKHVFNSHKITTRYLIKNHKDISKWEIYAKISRRY